MDDTTSQPYFYCEAYEFDAPKFQNFDLTPYRRRARFLETLLTTEQNTENLLDNVSIASNVSSPPASEPDIDWFQRRHLTHDSSDPPSPPIPLITPVIYKRVGLGSPGRIVRSTSSEKSRPASTPVRSRQTKTTTFSPLRLHSPLRPDPAISSSAVKPNTPMSKFHRMDITHYSDGGMSRSPSPPRLHHDITNLDNIEMLDVHELHEHQDHTEGNYSRRNSENLSDFDLMQDELIGMSRKVTSHANVTMRPQRVLIEAETSSPTTRTVSKGRLCPPPTGGVRKAAHVERTAPSRIFGRHANVQAVDIKKLLSEHNQRVRRR